MWCCKLTGWYIQFSIVDSEKYMCIVQGSTADLVHYDMIYIFFVMKDNK